MSALATSFTDAELSACAQREVRQRRRVYPRLVDSGRMERDRASLEIAMMEAIARHYARRAEAAPAASGRLL